MIDETMQIEVIKMFHCEPERLPIGLFIYATIIIVLLIYISGGTLEEKNLNLGYFFFSLF